MVLSIPSPEDHPTVLADWLEFRTLASSTNSIDLSTFTGELDLDQDFEYEDWSEYDTYLEDVVSRVTVEIDERRRLLQTSYPFTISDDARYVHLRAEWRDGDVIYLFCLAMSHATSSPILSNGLLPTLHSARDLFQVCATLCAAGECRGPAVSFGWPRPDSSSFLAKLTEVYRLFGEGQARKHPLVSSSSQVKDSGIDVIAWTPSVNGLPGKQYLLGQAASGKNWRDKSVVNDIQQFHWEWFEIQPTSTPIPAMFIPFCLSELPETDDTTGDFLPQELIRERLLSLTRKYGRIFFRYRIPALAARAPELAASGITPIERLQDIPKLYEWVYAFRKRLLEAFEA